jgi:hypothetical protein
MKFRKIIREYFKNLHSNKLENLKEMDKFLDAYDLPKLYQEVINQLNRSITINETEPVIVSQQQKSSARQIYC